MLCLILSAVTDKTSGSSSSNNNNNTDNDNKCVLTGRVEPRQLSGPGVLRAPARRRAASSRPVLVPVRILLRHGPVPDVGLGEKRRRHIPCSLLPPALAFSYKTSIINLSRSVAGWFCLCPGLRWLLLWPDGGRRLKQLMLAVMYGSSLVPPGNTRTALRWHTDLFHKVLATTASVSERLTHVSVYIKKKKRFGIAAFIARVLLNKLYFSVWNSCRVNCRDRLHFAVTIKSGSGTSSSVQVHSYTIKLPNKERPFCFLQLKLVSSSLLPSGSTCKFKLVQVSAS